MFGPACALLCIFLWENIVRAIVTYIGAGQSHRDRVNKKLNCQEHFLLLHSKLSHFFQIQKKINEMRKNGRYLITTLFKKGEFRVHSRLLFCAVCAVQWLGLWANVDVLLFEVNLTYVPITKHESHLNPNTQPACHYLKYTITMLYCNWCSDSK